MLTTLAAEYREAVVQCLGKTREKNFGQCGKKLL